MFVISSFVFYFVGFFSRVALLAGGDVLALLLFSAIGRFSHGFPVFSIDTLHTADPFIAGILFLPLSLSLMNWFQKFLLEMK